MTLLDHPQAILDTCTNGSKKYLDAAACAITGPNRRQEVRCSVKGSVTVLEGADPGQPWPGQLVSWEVTSTSCNSQQSNSKTYQREEGLRV